MSGHSHWSTIKHKKQSKDKARSKKFAKLSNLITIAAREGGGDPETNPKLKSAIDRAKDADMPSDNIERAVDRGTGKGLEGSLEKVRYEAIGPAKVKFIIEGITDNKNRTRDKIRQTLEKKGGKLTASGAVKWSFEQKGVIVIIPKDNNKEEVELAAIEAGAEDIEIDEGEILIYTNAKELQEVRESLEKEVKIKEANIEWVPKETTSVNEEQEEKINKIMEELDDNPAVQEVFTNIK